jgi:hypothetical protein
MEVRQTMGESAVPKGLMILLAICAAIALAGAGALITKNLSASSAGGYTQVHPAPGTVLRQDNPVKAGGYTQVHPAPGTVLRQDNPVKVAPALIDRGAEQQSGSAVGTHTGRSSGTQSESGGSVATPAPINDEKPGFRF